MDPHAAVALARRLLDEHGLDGWTVVLDRAKTRAGVCRPGRREIGLSADLTRLHSDDQVRETILHEIAHALVGPSHGHDGVWRAAALRIGCSGERCAPADLPRVDGPWAGTCPAGHVQRRHRRPTRVVSCSRCAPSFDPGHLFTWTYRGEPAEMHPNYEAELTRLRAPAGPVRPRPRVGDRVRVTAPGRFQGLVGEVQKRGRTRYHVRVPAGLLAVPFALVEPA
jgi:SprT-like family